MMLVASSSVEYQLVRITFARISERKIIEVLIFKTNRTTGLMQSKFGCFELKAKDVLIFLAGDRFVVTRRLGFEDVRLIALHAFLKLCILGYVVLWQICTLHQYADFEAISAYGNIWDGELLNSSVSRKHCSNVSYDWGKDFTPDERSLAGAADFYNMQCINFDRSRHIVVDSNSFVAVTSEVHDYQNGTSHFYFTDSPERAVLNMIHGFTSSFLQNGITNPSTTLSKKDGKTYQIFSKDQIFGPVAMFDVLKLSGVSLDDRNIQPWYRGGDPSQSPFYRVSGIVLIMRIEYSNFRQYEFAGSPRSGRPQAQVTVEALPSAWGFLGRSQSFDPQTLEPVSIRRTGIKVQIIFSGQYGRFDFVQLVRRILEGVVLFGMASYGTEMIARWLIYRTSYEHITSDCLGRDQLAALRRNKARAVLDGGPAMPRQLLGSEQNPDHDQAKVDDPGARQMIVTATP
jgi:hypothetical protein